jgi:LacI family transcriptional regulator, galactose operon repressor
MKDVAAVAGVSLSTVSRVVGGNPLVDPELAVKVERAIAVLGYRHNHTAGTLRRANGLSASIGLVFEDVANPFFSAIHRGVEDVARARSVVTFAGSSDEDPERERELVEALLARRVDGLVIAATAEDHSYLRRDVDAGIAFVFVDRPPASLDADSVLSDNRGGAQRAVSHLVARGHRRIAFIGFPPIRYTAVERLAGYRAGLSHAGIPEAPELVRHPEAAGEAYDVALELLEAPLPPTALFTSQNLLTVEVLRALHRRRRQHEIALVGFDDIVLAGSIEPAISVIEQDARGIGRAAAELLFSRLDGYRGAPRRVELATPLIARGSGELKP